MQTTTIKEFLNQLKDLINQNDYESCINLLLNAIDQYPHEHKLKLNLGNVYKVLGDTSNAKEIYNSLLDTSYRTISQNNLALIMLEEGEIDECIKYSRDALKNDNKYTDAKFNLALGLFEKKEYLDSLKLCNELQSDSIYKDKALELKTRINQLVCSWDSFTQIEEKLKSNKVIVHPFLHISHIINEESNHINATKWNNFNSCEVKKNNRPLNISNKIRLGFLCGEIRNHPTFYLIKNLFKNIKNSDFSMFMFSYNHADNEKKYIEQHFDEFIDITNLNFVDGHKKIKSYKLDILIDLTTIISHNRSNMLDGNLAKKSIAYLAFPGTTGKRVYDYILTDKVVTPKSMQKYYNEEFLYLPGCYQVNNGELNTKIKTKRESYNLPSDGLILGCLNQSFKLDPIFFNIWIEILEEYENTYLWLLEEGAVMKNNIVSFIKNRIDSNRVIFAEKMEYTKHLDRIQHIDIALDTRIYNGHTTSIEMLQAGVPLVTLRGNHFASRVSTSILNALGMNKLITKSNIEYKNKIISLIDENTRASIKKEIIDSLEKSQLLDNKYFSNNFIKTVLGLIT